MGDVAEIPDIGLEPVVIDEVVVLPALRSDEIDAQVRAECVVLIEEVPDRGEERHRVEHRLDVAGERHVEMAGVEQAVTVPGHGEVGRVEPVGDHRILARRNGRILREELLEGLLRRHDDVIRALDHAALERVLEAPAHAAALIGLLSPDALRPRVAEIGDPRDVGGALEHEPEHLAGVRRRARIDDRGPLLADERHALEEGARHPRDLRVGNQDVGLHEPGGPLEHLPQAAPPRPGPRTRRGLARGCVPTRGDQALGCAAEPLKLEGARAMHLHGWGDLREERRVLKRPVGVAHGLHDRKPALLRQVLDELERSLHPAAALRRETVRENEDFTARAPGNVPDAIRAPSQLRYRAFSAHWLSRTTSS